MHTNVHKDRRHYSLIKLLMQCLDYRKAILSHGADGKRLVAINAIVSTRVWTDWQDVMDIFVYTLYECIAVGHIWNDISVNTHGKVRQIKYICGSDTVLTLSFSMYIATLSPIPSNMLTMLVKVILVLNSLFETIILIQSLSHLAMPIVAYVIFYDSLSVFKCMPKIYKKHNYLRSGRCSTVPLYLSSTPRKQIHLVQCVCFKW
jgi:hypothetical protein